MNAVFSAALLVAALAPWFEARAWGVPVSYVPLARMARTFLSAGVVTLLAGGLAWLMPSRVTAMREELWFDRSKVARAPGVSPKRWSGTRTRYSSEP